ncbi:GHMP kinase [Neobacillus niacini]|uniref:GHMP family kinase ATP-binding protein n=1 Tax=Neobacillus niacini TaxID=86668 RepID=UPI0021CB63DD|nr:GHMP kinase [Neobacillus niacini]MCM3763517.1 GHMP kinase [Neobacillus niacini]
MIIRSRAPLRLGLAGGGTDLSPFCDEYGGVVLNVTINMFAYCTIETTDGDTITFEAKDMQVTESINHDQELAPGEIDSPLKLHLGVYRRIRKMYGELPSAFKMTTYNEASVGSGLGGSSTMVVAILKAYVEWLNLPLGEYDIAHLAWEIERKDLGLAGGKQDQYAATFGGFNFIEFEANDKVIVNPLRIKNWIRNELEDSLVLFYTGKSRESANIINQQIKAVQDDDKKLRALLELKNVAYQMKEAVLVGDFKKFGEALNQGWAAKKTTADVISNPMLEEIYDAVIDAGGIAGKLSGAGGGGFFMFYVNPAKRLDVIRALERFEGKIVTTQFFKDGTLGWKIQ